MVAYKSKFGEIEDHVQHLPLAIGVNECCHDELSQYLSVAKVSFHLHELLHVSLCGHISVMEKVDHKEYMHITLDEALEYTNLNKIIIFIQIYDKNFS